MTPTGSMLTRRARFRPKIDPSEADAATIFPRDSSSTTIDWPNIRGSASNMYSRRAGCRKSGTFMRTRKPTRVAPHHWKAKLPIEAPATAPTMKPVAEASPDDVQATPPTMIPRL